jgi:hypothetical protein
MKIGKIDRSPFKSKIPKLKFQFKVSRFGRESDLRVCAAAFLRLGLNGAGRPKDEQGALSLLY